MKPAEDVSTAPLAALGLVGGYLSARETHSRPLGGVVLALAGVYAGRSWWKRGGLGDTALLTGVYLGGFGLSHVLSKKVGPWPSVLTVAAASAAASALVSDAKRP